MGKVLGITEEELDDIIRQSLRKSLGKTKKLKESSEKKRQEYKKDQLKDFKAKKKQVEIEEVEDDTEEKPEDSGPAEVEVSNNTMKTSATAEEVIDFLNLIRSGRSLKDEEVRKDFQLYFDGLSGAERIALFSFVQALADVISGENTDEDIRNEPSPDDYGIKIDKQKVKKKSKTKKSSSKKPSGSSSSPIIVGERADKSKEKRLLKELK